MLARLYATASRIHGWLRRRRRDSEFTEELHAHLSLLTDEYVRRGMPLDEAARAARVRLGGITQLREERRDRSGLPLLDMLGQDVRYALRILARNPGFALVSILTVALGIGINTTVFTLIDAVAFKRLPVADPDHIFRLERWFSNGARGDVQYAFSVEEYAYFRDHTQQLSTVIAVSWPAPVPADAGGEMLHGQMVSGNYFAALGAVPAYGRTFLPEENLEPGASPVVVLSDVFWRRHFQADPLVVGRTMPLNGTAFTVIGVAPASFIGTGNPPQPPDFWAPLMMQAHLSPGSAWLDRPNVHRLQLLARLRAGASASQAQAELQVLASHLREQPETHQPNDKTIAFTLQPAVYFGGTDDLRFRLFVGVLMTLVSLILLAACANLANMLLARGAARRTEIGMRIALGASRGRLIGQLLTESLVLAGAGGIAGLAASLWASRALWTLVERLVGLVFLTDRPFVTSMSPDARIFGFALAVSLATGVLFGLSPALRLSRADPGTSVKDGRSRQRPWLMGAQMAISTLLLVCAGLFLRGLLRSQTADAEFETRRLYAMFAAQPVDLGTAPATQARLVDRLRQTPGVDEVALVDRFPFGGTWSPPVVAEDRAGEASGPVMRTLANYVSPTYFRATGIDIRRGRTFTRDEGERGAAVAIASESAARLLWPDSDPIGKRLKLDLRFTGQFTAFEVIGVAKDVRSASLSRIDPSYVYLPTRTSTEVYNILIRSDRDTAAVAAGVREAVAAVNPFQLPTAGVTNLATGPLMRIQMAIPRMLAACSWALACLALILAATGIYGVSSYLVAQRTREIGIRMALGATAGDVRWLIVRQGTTPAVIGGLFGLVGAAGISALLRSTLAAPSSPDLLFGVAAFDAPTFAGTVAFVAAVAAGACYFPARRATRVDPVVALRAE